MATCRLYAEDQQQQQQQQDLGSMGTGEIRKELESYGIQTKSFLEKKEMVAALEAARAAGKTPVNNGSTTETTVSSNSSGNSRSDGGASSENSSTNNSSRAERLKVETAKANAMKVGDLKTELQKRGISTASFFEKSEFVKAYAEAVVDGVTTAGGSGASNNKRSSAGGGTGSSSSSDEPRDPDYRDVVIQKMTRGDPRQVLGTVIDVTVRRP